MGVCVLILHRCIVATKIDETVFRRARIEDRDHSIVAIDELSPAIQRAGRTRPANKHSCATDRFHYRLTGGSLRCGDRRRKDLDFRFDPK
jgi:hypothetical protein